VDNGWEQEKLEFRKMLINRNREVSHMSIAYCVGRIRGMQNPLPKKDATQF
jgi:hypothetical protein